MNFNGQQHDRLAVNWIQLHQGERESERERVQSERESREGECCRTLIPGIQRQIYRYRITLHVVYDYLTIVVNYSHPLGDSIRTLASPLSDCNAIMALIVAKIENNNGFNCYPLSIICIVNHSHSSIRRADDGDRKTNSSTLSGADEGEFFVLSLPLSLP